MSNYIIAAVSVIILTALLVLFFKKFSYRDGFYGGTAGDDLQQDARIFDPDFITIPTYEESYRYPMQRHFDVPNPNRDKYKKEIELEEWLGRFPVQFARH